MKTLKDIRLSKARRKKTNKRELDKFREKPTDTKVYELQNTDSIQNISH